MLSDSSYIKIFYDELELTENYYYNSNCRLILFRFLTLSKIHEKIISKYNIFINYTTLLKSCNDLCEKGILDKKINNLHIEFSLKSYKNYTADGDYFKLINNRYSLTYKDYVNDIKQ
jgi:hypothetical protein